MGSKKTKVSAKELRVLLGIEDDDELAVLMMSILSRQVVMLHYLRGMFHLLEFYNHAFDTEHNMTHSYNGLRGLLDGLEETLWKHVPPRAAITPLFNWIEEGELPEDMLEILKCDRHGRKFGPNDQEGELGNDSFRAAMGMEATKKKP